MGVDVDYKHPGYKDRQFHAKGINEHCSALPCFYWFRLVGLGYADVAWKRCRDCLVFTAAARLLWLRAGLYFDAATQEARLSGAARTMGKTSQDTGESGAALSFRFATPADIAVIELLDSFSGSPTRDIHREIEKYFGSVDPSTHEHTVIFLAEMAGRVVAKAELMLPPQDTVGAVGYIKRVIVHPDFRVHGVARQLLQHLLAYAHEKLNLAALDLHVWDENQPAVRLYESLGFQLQHRELYFRLPL